MAAVGFFGRKSAGKTYAMRRLLAHIPKKDVYILDTNSEFVEYPNSTEPSSYNEDALNDFVLDVRLHKNVVAVVDDLDNYVKTTSQGEQFVNLVINGRHQNIGVIYATRRAAYLNRLITQNSDFLYLGYNMIPGDVAQVQKDVQIPGLFTAYAAVRARKFLKVDVNKRNVKLVMF